MSLFYKIFIPIFVTAAFILFTSELMNGSGSIGGKTGSPGDGFSTCSQCHGGTPSAQTGWISSNIPVTGYIPGQTYVITATNTHSGAVKYGFEITAENILGAKVGTLSITNPTETQFTNGGKAITHTQNGTSGTGGSKTWSVNWQAPTAGTGNVSFYAAFNAANGNGTSSGDVIYTSNLVAQENISTGISNINNNDKINIYPNPASDRLFIASKESLDGMPYFITDLSGKVKVNNSLKGELIEIPVDHLPRGVYFLSIGQISSQRIILQ